MRSRQLSNVRRLWVHRRIFVSTVVLTVGFYFSRENICSANIFRAPVLSIIHDPKKLFILCNCSYCIIKWKHINFFEGKFLPTALFQFIRPKRIVLSHLWRRLNSSVVWRLIKFFFENEAGSVVCTQKLQGICRVRHFLGQSLKKCLIIGKILSKCIY